MHKQAAQAQSRFGALGRLAGEAAYADQVALLIGGQQGLAVAGEALNAGEPILTQPVEVAMPIRGRRRAQAFEVAGGARR